MQVMRELKDALIRLVVDPSIHQVVDIYVVDIPESYGMLLNRDWSSQIGGYFATDWSHMLIPKKVQNQYERIEQEQYMKHTVTDLEAQYEAMMFTNSIPGNYFFEVDFG